MNGAADILGYTLFYMLPALVANASPVLLGPGHPVDFGRVMGDGRRVFGDGKTFEGLVLGLSAGVFIGVSEATFWAPQAFAVYAAALSAGALLGDLAGAFVKRRLGLRRGAPAPLLDQLDFVLGAYLVSAAASAASGSGFRVFGDVLPLSTQLDVVLTSLYLVPLLHLATNAAAFRLKLKPNPW
ncbi:MAG: CDP-2,3-bis-(O-geranylgeranyl)-sn-glycerol synthase [Candidatus Marsarchaeota archaeon]|nr:CDP-2,3-bis-(O-geranylgeranyl)-sn-glycerol synthase [Candidatus Marsarchaeota archaeon]